MWLYRGIKSKDNWKGGREMKSIFEYLEIFIYGFFLFFFLIYIGKYGLTDLILKGGTTHEILFNIGVWFVLVTFCIDGLMRSLKWKEEGK